MICRRILLCAAVLFAWGAPCAHADVGADVLKAAKRALRGDDADAKRRAVTDVGRFRGQFSEQQMRSAALLLRKALNRESDREVRRLTVRALARLESAAAWVPVVLASFDEPDLHVRKTARLEVLGGGAALLAVVQKLLKEDKDPTFRGNLLLTLGARRRFDAVPTLIAHLADKARPVVAAAAEGLEAISGQAFGYDAKAWSTWFDAWQKAHADAIAKEASKTVADKGIGEEPPPHVTRSLVPRFYKLPLHAKDIVFVVDISGSVGSGGVERAKKELVKAVELLGSDVHISAMFFSDEVKLWKPEMVPATPANKAALRFFLRGIAPGKRTDVFTPLHAGIQIARKRIAAKKAAGEPFRTPVTMIAVSDGRDNMAKTPARVVEDKLDRLDLEHAVVHAIVLGANDSPLMHALARRGGGHYLRIP